MERLSTILAAMDGSPQGHRAALRATYLAGALRIDTLEIMTVENEPTWSEGHAAPAAISTVAATIETLATSRAPLAQLGTITPIGRTRCVSSIRYGKPATAIAERARELNADLAVVAARGRGFMADLRTRRCNSELVRHTTCPMLLVNLAPELRYVRVLIPTDFSAESMAAAQLAHLLAPAAHITFLHVFRLKDEGLMRELDVPPKVIASERHRAAQQAQQELNEFIAGLGPAFRLAGRAVEHGQPVFVIERYAAQMGVQLIAIGRRGQSRLQEFLLGSVAQRLVDQATTDLLVVSAPSDSNDWRDRPAA